ncbi:MAG: hypothetical protein RIT04_112 [Candidatus Parcubacteria bacterium]|jgi:hypothetical protein
MKKLGFIIICIFAVIGFGLVAVYVAVELGWTKTAGVIDMQHDYFKKQAQTDSQNQTEAWNSNEEWISLKEAIKKDTSTINLAAKDSGVPARLIVASLVVEQLRLFHSEREIFKAVFGPLKILGNQSQFSWGVMGIKQDTARQIENFLASSTSPWYIGSKMAHILDYPATSTMKDRDAMRFARLTDEENRYYSYLYAGIAMRETLAQWQHAGMPIDIGSRPGAGIVATLYNIGFENSHPNKNPQIGGAEIKIADKSYSFGGLAQAFYDSNELINEFPR